MKLPENLSPKTAVAFLLPFIAAFVLWRLTGDDSYLIGLLVAAVLSGGGAALAPPAKGVEQRQITRVAKGEAKIVPR